MNLERMFLVAAAVVVVIIVAAAASVTLMVASCTPECTDAEVDRCAREYYTTESFCDCLDIAGCEGSCEWQRAGCE